MEIEQEDVVVRKMKCHLCKKKSDEYLIIPTKYCIKAPINAVMCEHCCKECLARAQGCPTVGQARAIAAKALKNANGATN